MAEDAAVEAVVRAILSDLRQKFQLSEAHCNLIAKDIEEIAQEPADRRGNIIQAIEKEIANSVSGRRERGACSSGSGEAQWRPTVCFPAGSIVRGRSSSS